jgi:hypothetical protein
LIENNQRQTRIPDQGILMATKRHKNLMACVIIKAPMGARNMRVAGQMPLAFFCGKKIPGKVSAVTD